MVYYPLCFLKYKDKGMYKTLILSFLPMFVKCSLLFFRKNILVNYKCLKEVLEKLSGIERDVIMYNDEFCDICRSPCTEARDKKCVQSLVGTCFKDHKGDRRITLR
jgi:hypothetical protein